MNPGDHVRIREGASIWVGYHGRECKYLGPDHRLAGHSVVLDQPPASPYRGAQLLVRDRDLEPVA